MDTLPKLSPAQRLLLRTAARRADGRVIPPANMRGGARVKVLTALLQRGRIDPADSGHVLTDAGYAAIGLQRPVPVQPMDATDDLQLLEGIPIRPGTKLAALVAALRRPQGATSLQLMRFWRPSRADAPARLTDRTDYVVTPTSARACAPHRELRQPVSDPSDGVQNARGPISAIQAANQPQPRSSIVFSSLASTSSVRRTASPGSRASSCRGALLDPFARQPSAFRMQRTPTGTRQPRPVARTGHHQMTGPVVVPSDELETRQGVRSLRRRSDAR